ncbi:unnamed protein product, partial [marine sediment metagenome]
MKKKGPVPLKEALEDYFKRKRWDKKIKGYHTINCWT